MVEFLGDLSGDYKRYTAKQQAKYNFLVSCIVSTIITVIIIIFSIKVHWIFVVFMVPIIFLIICSSIIPKGKILDYVLPTQIIIINNLITCKGKKFCTTKELNCVKKVIEKENFYQIIFRFPYKDLRFICQKDLLVNGSIDDFKDIFKDKIVKSKKAFKN